MVYLVAFNLQTQNHNYDIFFAALQAGRGWFNFFDNAWLVDTDETAEQLTQRLNMYLGDQDYLLVIRVTPDYYGLLPQEAWQWLEAELRSGSLR